MRDSRVKLLVAAAVVAAFTATPAVALADSGPDVNWYFAAAPEVYLPMGRGVLLYAGLTVVVTSAVAFIVLWRMARVSPTPETEHGDDRGL